MCSYGNASSRTGQVTTSPVQAVTRPPAGEDIDGGMCGTVSVWHQKAAVLMMQTLVFDATDCYEFSCLAKTRLFLLHSAVEMVSSQNRLSMRKMADRL